MSTVGGLLLLGGVLVLLGYRIHTASARLDRDLPALLDPIDEHARTAMALLAPDDLDELPDTGLAAEVTAYLRDLAEPPSVPIIPDPHTSTEE